MHQKREKGNQRKRKGKPDPIVVYDNNYMEAFYQTDYLAKKMMIASSLLSKHMEWTESGCNVVLSSNDLLELSGLSKNSLKHLEQAVDKLHQTVIRLRDPNNNNEWDSFVYLPDGKYRDGELTLTINKKMRPFIEKLTDNFTQYHIENIRPLKSGYSIRIFELLKMNAYRKEGYVEYPIIELRKRFDLQDKYKKYNDFKKNVILPAYKELKEFCEIYFEYDELKTGKSITKIRFYIYKQEKPFSGQYVNNVDQVSSQERTSILEKQLNELGWKGNFNNILQKVPEKAINAYLPSLRREIPEYKSILSSDQLHEFIETQIIDNAEKIYCILQKAVKASNDDKREKAVIKRLLEIDFVGAKKYVAKEGYERVEEALDILEYEYRDKKVHPGAGLLREKVRILKEIKNREKKTEEILVNEQKHIKKEKLEKLIHSKKELQEIYQLRIDSGYGKSIEEHFATDWELFLGFVKKQNLYTAGGKKEIDIYNEYKPVQIEDLPISCQEYFLDWKFLK